MANEGTHGADIPTLDFACPPAAPNKDPSPSNKYMARTHAVTPTIAKLRRGETHIENEMCILCIL